MMVIEVASAVGVALCELTCPSPQHIRATVILHALQDRPALPHGVHLDNVSLTLVDTLEGRFNALHLLLLLNQSLQVGTPSRPPDRCS